MKTVSDDSTATAASGADEAGGPTDGAVGPVPTAKRDGAEAAAIQANPWRRAFGVFLFATWGAATFIWVASTIHEAAAGDVTAVITAASTVALLLLLGAMEGLEVSVIDRWQSLWPGEPPSFLASWLSARQLFVALIVTAATLLANRSVLVIPGTSVKFSNGLVLSVFDLMWTTLTVLWFAQIFWKVMGAMNPDRYLRFLAKPLFPVVRFVYWVGISQPGEWTASAAARALDWSLTRDEHEERRPEHELPHAAIWRELGHAHAREGLRRQRIRSFWRGLRKPRHA